MAIKISEKSAQPNRKIPHYVAWLIELAIVLLMIAISYPIWAPYSPFRQPRGTTSFSHKIFRFCAEAGNEYYRENGHFPPELNGSTFYGPMNDVFGKAVPVTYPPDYVKGPIVDPHRVKPEFPNEKRLTCMYNSPRNPDGWVKFRGYPPRYFRSADGKWGILLSNGLDGQVTITDKILLGLNSNAMTTTQSATVLMPYTYDPTNGIWSSGDVWRLMQPTTTNIER